MREKSIIIWIVLGIVLAILFNLPLGLSQAVKGGIREALAPVQSVASNTARKFRESVDSLRGIGRIVKENRKMASELVRLRDEVIRLRGLERENIELREILQFQRDSIRKLLPSEVIARDMSGWWRTIRLNRGAIDGVTENMAVVTSDGLIGKTVDVSPRTADVLLISDPACRVSAQVSRGGLFGIVSGKDVEREGRVVGQVDFINKDKEIRPGDELITSGLGGVFPKGLLIGYVETIQVDGSGLYQAATFVPKADFGALEYVFIVMDESDPIRDLLRRRGLGLEGTRP